MDHDQIRAAAADLKAAGASAPLRGRDPINQPMIHNWVEAMGDAGRHARSTIGVASLPLDAPVEVEGMFLLR